MKEILIDRKTADTRRNMLWRGAGMVSANNSSRLLMDYKKDHPDSYWRILGYIFGEKGIRIEHLKIEMGSDINSSSGTEPCVKRSPGEKADVTRGAGFMLCHDAKQINPDLSLDMLWWGEPKWIETADDVYDARYRWYKETLDAAYEKYGLILLIRCILSNSAICTPYNNSHAPKYLKKNDFIKRLLCVAFVISYHYSFSCDTLMRDMPSEKVIYTGYVSLWDKTVSANVNAARFIERKTIGGYTAIENAFVRAFLLDDGETVSDAKLRLAEKQRVYHF